MRRDDIDRPTAHIRIYRPFKTGCREKAALRTNIQACYEYIPFSIPAVAKSMVVVVTAMSTRKSGAMRSLVSANRLVGSSVRRSKNVLKKM